MRFRNEPVLNATCAKAQPHFAYCLRPYRNIIKNTFVTTFYCRKHAESPVPRRHRAPETECLNGLTPFAHGMRIQMFAARRWSAENAEHLPLVNV